MITVNNNNSDSTAPNKDNDDNDTDYNNAYNNDNIHHWEATQRKKEKKRNPELEAHTFF